MRILGINKGSTLRGKALKDGGAALYAAAQFTAIGEERVTGFKHKGGFDKAVRYLLPDSPFPYSDDFDVVAVSTCCEARETAMLGHAFEGDPRLVAIGHHDSHAALAYFMSGLDSALIVVADGGGNTVGAVAETDQWWASHREQVSYYEATGGRISLIDRDFFEPYEAGLAEIYRAFTYYLGWHSYVHASRTMALAGINTDGAVARWPTLFHVSGEHLRSPISNDPLDPISMVRRIGDILRIPFGEPRALHAPITLAHARIAAYVQRCLEDALVDRIRRLAKATGLTSVCLGGGVALNAVSNAKLANATGCHIFVPAAPGDDGQAIGNVLAVLHDHHLLNAPRGRLPSTPFLGPEPALCSASISQRISQHGLDAVVLDGGDVAAHIAAAVAGGELVCLYEGRSEFGPRALGHRSILGDPRSRHTAAILNDLKGRPQFMPFAPVMSHRRGRPDLRRRHGEPVYVIRSVRWSSQTKGCGRGRPCQRDVQGSDDLAYGRFQLVPRTRALRYLHRSRGAGEHQLQRWWRTNRRDG